MVIGVLRKIYDPRLRSEEVCGDMAIYIKIWPEPAGRGSYHRKLPMTEVEGRIFA